MLNELIVDKRGWYEGPPPLICKIALLFPLFNKKSIFKSHWGLQKGFLAKLYQGLLSPLEAQIQDAARLVIVPHNALHYVPFLVLHDGEGYQLLA